MLEARDAEPDQSGAAQDGATSSEGSEEGARQPRASTSDPTYVSTEPSASFQTFPVVQKIHGTPHAARRSARAQADGAESSQPLPSARSSSPGHPPESPSRSSKRQANLQSPALAGTLRADIEALSLDRTSAPIDPSSADITDEWHAGTSSTPTRLNRRHTSSNVFPLKKEINRRGSGGTEEGPAEAREQVVGATQRTTHDSGRGSGGSRRGSEASIWTTPLPGESQLPPPIDSRHAYSTTRAAIFPTIQPTRTSRYRPPTSTSTRSASPPLSLASSKSSDTQSLASSAEQRRPPPRPIVSPTSDGSFTSSPRSFGTSTRSSTASLRSSGPSLSSASTRLSDGPQSIFLNPEHKSRSISELVSLPKFFKKGKTASSAPPGRRSGGSTSILDAALSSSQTWANPARVPSTVHRGSYGSLSSEALAAAMARNPRRISSVNSLADSEMSSGNGPSLRDSGVRLRQDIFVTKPRDEQELKAQGLGLLSLD